MIRVESNGLVGNFAVVERDEEGKLLRYFATGLTKVGATEMAVKLGAGDHRNDFEGDGGPMPEVGS